MSTLFAIKRAIKYCMIEPHTLDPLIKNIINITMIPPQTLSPLSEDQRLALIDCFINNTMLKESPSQSFGLDIVPALEIVTPIINNVLGVDTWECTGSHWRARGNFFLASSGFRVHADTGNDGPDKVLQTFVFPLEMTFKEGETPRLDQNKFIVLNQTWAGDSAFFLRGDPDERKPNEYSIVVKDYSTIGNLEEGTMDGRLLDNCPHLNPSNFYGLTIDKMFQWTPGVPMTFPRNRLHLNTPFTRHGIATKLGLSIFTSRK